MLKPTHANNVRVRSSFLGLMKKFRVQEYNIQISEFDNVQTNTIIFNTFAKYYTPLISISHVFSLTDYWATLSQITTVATHRTFIKYYGDLSSLAATPYGFTIPQMFFHTLTINNLVVFSKPRKQLFLTFFRSKPIFVFTGGLMRLVMNEKRKSSRKSHKVAVSLIKLSTILLAKRNYLTSCYLKLKNIGRIRAKILQSFTQARVFHKIHYVFVYFTLDQRAQKLPTRRSIKKYIKKRFK